MRGVLIRGRKCCLELLAWSVPNIDTFVQDPPAFLSATLPTRVKLSFRSEGDCFEALETMLAALPLDGLLTLVAENLYRSFFCREPTWTTFWRTFLPNWPLLLRVPLGLEALSAFMKALLVDCKDPLLPSLTELVVVQTTLDNTLTPYLRLRDALMKRARQGVPLKTLDLRMCHRNLYKRAVQSLREIAIDILGPEDTEGFVEASTSVSTLLRFCGRL